MSTDITCYICWEKHSYLNPVHQCCNCPGDLSYAHIECISKLVEVSFPRKKRCQFCHCDYSDCIEWHEQYKDDVAVMMTGIGYILFYCWLPSIIGTLIGIITFQTALCIMLLSEFLLLIDVVRRGKYHLFSLSLYF